MILEISLDGVFVPAALLWAVLALLASAMAQQVLSRVGFYGFVWHPALFNFALFVVLWSAIAAIPWQLVFLAS